MIPVLRYYLHIAVALTCVSLASCLYASQSVLTANTPDAVTIIETNYPVPQDAFYVATNGSDANDGSAAAPWRTLSKATTAAPSGATIVLREGVYREGPASIFRKSLTIQPYPREQVWLKGSLVVSDWVVDGNAWRHDGWTYEFDEKAFEKIALDENPLAVWPDMVFVDGQPLRQVATRAELTADTFYVDDAGNALYVGNDPANRLVEAAAFSQALKIDQSQHVTVRGLGFMHYAPYFKADQKSMVRAFSDNLVFENNTFAWSAAGGLSFEGNGMVVRGNKFLYNGHLGFYSWESQNVTLENNIFAHNNQEGFNQFWEAGGLKLLRCNNVVIRDNIVRNNIGDGIWLDDDCKNVVVVRNFSAYNAKHGIQYELSSDGIIASNVFAHNKSAGIQAGWVSRNIAVYNNTTANNKINILIAGDWDRSRIGVTSGITVKNNLMSNNDGSNSTLFSTYDWTNTLTNTGPLMIVEFDYNMYYRRSTSVPRNLLGWKHTTSISLYTELRTFQQASGRELHSVSINNTEVNPFFVNEAVENYRLRSDSIARNAGAPLPQAVADAIGVPAGVPVDVGALYWPGNELPVTPTPTMSSPTPTPPINQGSPTTTTTTVTTPTTGGPGSPTPTTTVTPGPGNPTSPTSIGTTPATTPLPSSGQPAVYIPLIQS